MGKLSQVNLVYIYSCCMLYVPVSEKLHVVQGSYNRGEGNQGKKQNLGKNMAKLKVTWVKTNARTSLPGQAFARAQNPEPSKRTEFTGVANKN